MAVGEADLPELLPVGGVRIGVSSAGIKTPGRLDLVVFELAPDSRVAAVFTRNAFCAAPVVVARQHLAAAVPRLLMINTGNANAGTGMQGLEDARRCCQSLANLTGVEFQQVLPFSTGVIGEALPADKIQQALPAALQQLSENGWQAAADGILTTDTRPKGASRRLSLALGDITITGIAKGSGMIKPNMATMLAYVATDAVVGQAALQSLLEKSVDASFNRITVDGDTSTNDATLLIATGASGLELQQDTPDWELFSAAVTELMIELAHAIVKDGEGATKFVAVEVRGGGAAAECIAVGYAVAESPLVKTALFASDANWGRILAAVGRAGLHELDVAGVRVWINDVLVAEHGARASSYTEELGSAAMARENIHITIDLGRGQYSDTVWTTDLSHDYIRINAEYRS
jgi:glutamate N-acetyltransferase/amino-acid N-acetyltransferase